MFHALDIAPGITAKLECYESRRGVLARNAGTRNATGARRFPPHGKLRASPALYGAGPAPPWQGQPARRRRKAGAHRAPLQKATAQGGPSNSRQVTGSLIPKPEMAEKNLAAHHLNGSRSRGPAMPGGTARCALMAPNDPNSLPMRRMENANFRQVASVTSLLIEDETPRAPDASFRRGRGLPRCIRKKRG